MTYPLCDDKNNLDECNPFKEKGLQERNTAFYSSRNCVMAVSFQYLLATAQEIVRKEKKAKSARKGIRLLCMIIRLKNPNTNLK